MRIMACGDQHWTTRKPKNRIDDFFLTCMGKLKQEIAIAKEEGCECILFPGDLFESFRENHLLVQEVMKILDTFNGSIIAIAGQHDQQFHNSDLKGTPLHTLETAKYLMIAGKDPIHLTNGVRVYGASWKDEIPEIIDPKCVNILIIHKMIINDKLWAQQEGHTWANHMLIKHKFDLIASGDNHNGFLSSSKDRYLINCGSMMRSTVAQVNHKPSVAVYDTDQKTVDWIELEVKPISEVMSIEKVEKEKERNASLDAFVESLSGNTHEGHSVKLNFVDRLEGYIEKNNIDEEVANIIFETLE